MLHFAVVIRSFRHKGLRDLFRSGHSRRIGSDMTMRAQRILDVLDGAFRPEDMNLPGFHFHRLRGDPVRYSIRINANWRLTFGWDDGEAVEVDLEDYH